MKKNTLLTFLTLLVYNLTFGQHLVKITSEPAEAVVFADGELLASTPCAINMSKNGQKTITIQLAGYFIDTLDFDPAKKEYSKMIVLKEIPPASSLLEGRETELLVLSKVFFSIIDGTTLGKHDDTQSRMFDNIYSWNNIFQLNYESLKQVIDNRLKEENVNVAIVNKSFPESSQDVRKAKFSLAADVTAVELNTVGKTTDLREVSCKIKVSWTLLNNKSNEVIYTDTSSGIFQSKESMDMMNLILALNGALTNATANLLTHRPFIDHILKKETANAEIPAGSTEPIHLDPVELESFANNSQLIKRAVESAVSIKTERGIGSGFIVSADGLLVTNHHVIEKADEIEIIFSNGYIVSGEVIRSDEKWDLALVKVNVKNLKPLPIETAGSYGIGDEVVAIGTPKLLALGQTVTKGIVSGMRDGEEGRKYIQTDVSINPGNSGGPLINNEGMVIGCVVAKFDGEGLGLAIPAKIISETLKLDYKK